MSEKAVIVEKKQMVIGRPLKMISTKSPIVIRKDNKIKVLPNYNLNKLLLRNLKLGPTSTFYKEDVIYESKQGDFLGDSQKIKIVNKLNILTNESRTLATYTDNATGKVLEKTSDLICQTIGQLNFDTVLNALLSECLSEELKVKAILALLKDAVLEDKCVQTEDIKKEPNEDSYKKSIDVKKETTEEKSCQTEENSMDLINKMKQKKRVKRSVLTPYPVKDIPITIKKVTINPDNPNDRRIIQDLDKNIKFETKEQLPEHYNPLESGSGHIPEMPVLQLPIGIEQDDTSDGFDRCSVKTISTNADNNYLNVLNLVGECTSTNQPMLQTNYNVSYSIEIPGQEPIRVPVKPEDHFHIATKEILKHIPLWEDRVRLCKYQGKIDWYCCLLPDAEGYYPLHNAVLNKDLDLVRRQCGVLKNRQDIDILTGNNMTALQLSILEGSPECTALLLQYGSDPLYVDEDHRTTLHLAADSEMSDHLAAILNHCKLNAREVLLGDKEELWKVDYETKSNEELAVILLKYLCEMKDSQGYTPLMLASNVGNYTNVKMLVEACPQCVNVTRPNCGSTALSLAVAESCLHAANSGNKSKIADHFRQTITILLENGADPTIPNHGGTNVHDLLTETNNNELSMLFANHNGVMAPSDFGKYMIVKSENDMAVTEIKNNKGKKTAKTKTPKTKNSKAKPVIIENKVLPPTMTVKPMLPDQKNIINTKHDYIQDIKIINPQTIVTNVRNIPVPVTQILQTPITGKTVKNSEMNIPKTVLDPLSFMTKTPKRKSGNTAGPSKKVKSIQRVN